MADLIWMVVKALAGLICVGCLMRAYLQWLRLPAHNPLSQLCFKLTNWIVLPLRRALNSPGLLDWASLLAALLVTLVAVGFKATLFADQISGEGPWGLPAGPGFLLLALVWLIGWWLRFLVFLLIANVLMSWFGASPAAEAVRPVLAAMVEPMVGPIRQLLHKGRPQGLDFSPVVVFLLIQVVLAAHDEIDRGLNRVLFLI